MSSEEIKNEESLIGEVPAVEPVEPKPEETTIPHKEEDQTCLLYTSPSPRDGLLSRMPSSA